MKFQFKVPVSKGKFSQIFKVPVRTVPQMEVPKTFSCAQIIINNAEIPKLELWRFMGKLVHPFETPNQNRNFKSKFQHRGEILNRWWYPGCILTVKHLVFASQSNRFRKNDIVYILHKKKIQKLSKARILKHVSIIRLQLNMTSRVNCLILLHFTFLSLILLQVNFLCLWK